MVAPPRSPNTVLQVSALASSVFKAAAAYFAIVFAAGFALGTLRTLVMAPRVGELLAVLFELPVILAISWIACGRVMTRFRLPSRVLPRAAVGAVAFALLMLAELTLAIGLFGRSPNEQLAHFATPPGLLGLAGQILFGLFPIVRPRR